MEKKSQEDIELAGSGETSFLGSKKVEMGCGKYTLCVCVSFVKMLFQISFGFVWIEVKDYKIL